MRSTILNAIIAAACAAGTAQAQTGKSADEVYKTVCSACHAEGVAQAPKLGDKKAWAPRIREGQVGLTVDGWLGVRAMPPRGGSPDLTLEEFSRAVAHMARAAGAKWNDPDAAMLEKMRAAEKKRLAAKSGRK